ncbi:hypothetical protein R1sor_016355 [Riccia sorocarpa]|uniref:DUF7869 domain-containing protein n=1 Tax=Riccia sorocarpa TaxID=122646 RepID=A0ABD3HGL7_9MARC
MGRDGALDSTYFHLYGNGNMQPATDNVRETSFKKLPPVFMLQMDNSAKDNKNVHVLAFCSELVIRGIFETVEIITKHVNFLMVGHTHEDVDALFSKVSTRTINKDVLTIPALMAEVWESEMMHPVPMLLEEVADYKTYVGDFLRPLEDCLQWGFGPQTNQGTGYQPVEANQEDPRDVHDDGVVVIDALERKLQEENQLLLEPYVGDPANRPKRAFVPVEDISEGKFVILRPDDVFESEIPRAVWLGRAMGGVVRETSDEHHGQFLIEWWRP